MKLLLDANVSWRIVAQLKEHFDDCVHADNILELNFPAKDMDIWRFAKANDFIVITRDNDFANLTTLNGFPPKIVLLRTGNCSRKFTFELIVRSKHLIQDFLLSKEYGLLEIF